MLIWKGTVTEQKQGAIKRDKMLLEQEEKLRVTRWL